MWCEAEVRDLEPEPAALRTGGYRAAANVRAAVTEANLRRVHLFEHEVGPGHSPCVIYTPHAQRHGNFLPASYRRILARPEWAARLRKSHSAKHHARPSGANEEVRGWRELDAAVSSDALLMNIFCYPRVLAAAELPALLGVARGLQPVFGYRPRVPLAGSTRKTLSDRTEIDMRLGHLLFEAKLTESDFQFAPMRLVERYPAFDQVFDRTRIEQTRRGVRSYQLIRGVLAAYAEGARFCVLLDARRPDLMDAWYAVIGAIRSLQLQSQMRLLTWQEVSVALPNLLRGWLAEKYGIVAG